MKTYRKIPIARFLLLLVLGLLLTQCNGQANQFNEGLAAYEAGYYQKALNRIKPLAEQGYPDAQFSLGKMYSNGNGVPKNDTKALKWFRKAAEQGHTLAQTILGAIYLWEGQGTPKDYVEAVRWYRRAAEQGNPNAQFSLGIMYKMGWGVSQDYVQAYKWFSLSASHSPKSPDHARMVAAGLAGKHKPEDSVNDREEIETELTSDQIAEAQKLAREWKPKTWKELSQQN